MRFTKIPLIATLMAVALSLLIVLPGLAQTSGFDDTRGTLSSGSNLTVDVLSTPDDPDTTGTDEAVVGASYFNGNLYVSNSDDAYNTVRITAPTASKTEFAGPDQEKDQQVTAGETADAPTGQYDETADNIHCAVATVKNNRSGKKISVRFNNDSATGAETGANQPVTFKVVTNGLEEKSNDDRACGEEAGETVSITTLTEDTTANTTTADTTGTAAAVGARMPAKHGDTLTITVAGVAGSVMLTVDGEGPEFSELSPVHGAKLSSQTVKIRFVVSDSDSGLAHDGELSSSPDQDPEAVNGDDDNFTTTEPRADTNGAARDIQVMLKDNNESANGTSGWRQRGGRPGVSYFLDMAVTNVQSGSNPWYLQAKDRAGNSERTDSDPGETGDQDFSLVIDVSSPEFKDARTGISYDPDKKVEIADRSFVALSFEDATGPDAVKAVDHTKFLVEDAEVVGFVHLSDKSDCNDPPEEDDSPHDIDGACITNVPQSRIYLELAEPLAPNATPQVSMFGGAVLDLAGNPSNQDEIVAADNIAPAISVTLATDVTGRPVIKNNGEVMVSITSDEELRRRPTVWFAELVEASGSTKDKLKLQLGIPRRGERVQETVAAENAWSRTFDNGDVGSGDGLYAVIVIAEDGADNVGTTPGWTRQRKTKEPAANGSANLGDLGDAGLLLEIDTDANNDEDPVFSLSPQSTADGDETESNNPFITIDFGAEAGEYTSSSSSFKSDSHSAVEIVSITLNGSDVSGDVAAVENNKYTLAAKDLGIGEYELKVTGRDDVGNEVSDTHEFEVTARRAYKLGLVPGWNLVSLPGTPIDSSVQAVMSDSMQASIVLAYQDDVWLTAVNDNGTWRGTLTDIVGGYGYWVQTTAFEDISALIPETDTSSILPTASVIKGWNLLGVVDVLQAGAGKTPSGGGEADDYFDNIAWKVAYSFNTTTNQWEKSIPDDGPESSADAKEIVNGKGYWVWSTEAGTLVP